MGRSEASLSASPSGPRRSPRIAALQKKAVSVSSDTSEGYIIGRGLTGNPKPSLNFIQVCRNYFRSHSWLTQKGLSFMYSTAVASYVYANCPAIDITIPIKVGSKFHPALVSDKCWDSIGSADMQNALDVITKMTMGQAHSAF